MGWLEGWSYRKSITLSRASGAVTNYQMKVLVGESAGATGEDVDCGGKCLSNFDDLRFTATDGTTLLDYWIESITGTTPNQLATVWIEFNSINTNATTFYMYYGKGDASAQYATPLLAGEATFIFFDDFSGTFPGTKWAGNTAAGGVSGGILTITGNGTGWQLIYSALASGSATFALRGRVSITSGTKECGFGAETPTETHKATFYEDGANGEKYVQKDGTTQNVSPDENFGIAAYHLWDVIVRGGVNGRYFQDGVECSNSPDTNNPPNSTDMRAIFAVKDSGGCETADWILLRNYVYAEPAWGAWGTEEHSPIMVGSYLIGDPWLAEQTRSFLLGVLTFGDVNITRNYLFGDPQLINQERGYLLGGQWFFIGQGRNYLQGIITLVDRIVKPSAGSVFQRLRSVMREI
jgi:hypothetical protein